MNNKTLLRYYDDPSLEVQQTLIERPAMAHDTLLDTITEVFETIKREGDQAVRNYTTRFDAVDLDSMVIDVADYVEQHPITQALRESIDIAFDNIKRFHSTQKLTEAVQTHDGVSCWREARAIEKVGLYIPGGSAPLFSTVLMLGVPALIAGCREVILCTPPQQGAQTIHPAIAYAAQKCEITKIYLAGGAQAIAAMTLGTETIPAVYKIFGPGNQYVTAAKMKAQEYGVAIDLPAGPSEVLVYADEGARPEFIAADLLSQAEHGPDSQVVLVTTDVTLIGQVEKALEKQLSNLPRRDIAIQALAKGFAISFDDEAQALDFVNLYAPEHLIILQDDPTPIIPKIQNAGSVFLGHYTPESAGDYASGTNHTLPTAAYARNYSGVSLDSFIKKITFQQITAEGIQTLGPHIMNMATEEKLDAHAQAVKVRLQNLNT